MCVYVLPCIHLHLHGCIHAQRASIETFTPYVYGHSHTPEMHGIIQFEM